MGLFNFKKKKKENSMAGDIPLPPKPPQLDSMNLTQPNKSKNNLPDLKQVLSQDKTHRDLLDINTHTEHIGVSTPKPQLPQEPKASKKILDNSQGETKLEDIPEELPDLEINSPENPHENEFKNLDEVEKELGIDLEFTEEIKKQFSKTKNIPKDKFINIIENQKNIEKLNDSIRSLNEWKRRFNRINNLKNSQDSEYLKYRNALEDIERKLVYLDKSIFDETLY